MPTSIVFQTTFSLTQIYYEP